MIPNLDVKVLKELMGLMEEALEDFRRSRGRYGLFGEILVCVFRGILLLLYGLIGRIVGLSQECELAIFELGKIILVIEIVLAFVVGNYCQNN